ncbi:tetratricopeptide repeat protein [Streptomyces populi]|uniref:tetratricopeptide repeat protein n=1 Tax=Streptomyces populi TaxID=2058924 RepID=UPI0035E3A1EB
MQGQGGATTRQPAAADLLRTLAWCAPENIPIALADGSADPPAPNQAIGLLTAYNMITPAPSTGTLAVHRLVQALARIPDAHDPHRTRDHIDHTREQATSNLYNTLPDDVDDPATWPTWRTLLPHIDTLADHAETGTDTAITAYLLHGAGQFLTDQGSPAREIEHLQRSLTAYVRVLGEDHFRTLHSRNRLAVAHQGAGDLALAIPLPEQTLADQLRVLGPEHPNTRAAREGAAYWQARAHGQLPERGCRPSQPRPPAAAWNAVGCHGFAGVITVPRSHRWKDAAGGYPPIVPKCRRSGRQVEYGPHLPALDEQQRQPRRPRPLRSERSDCGLRDGRRAVTGMGPVSVSGPCRSPASSSCRAAPPPHRSP